MSRTTLIMAVSLIFAGIASDGFADEISRRVSAVTAIQDSEGRARVLFKPASRLDLTEVAIRRATLRFAATGSPVDRSFTLQVHPVTSPWEAGAVDWDRGWSRQGGDFDDRLYSRAEWDLNRGSTTLSFDMTILVKEMVEHGMFADGFILTVDPERGVGIPVADLPRLQALESASLEIIYRKVGPPRDRGGS